MIVDDSMDKDYARAIKAILDNTDSLSLEEIENKFYEAGSKFFLEDTQPKNIMLRVIHTGVIFDELDPYFPDSNPKETLERFKEITEDYLSGNFYPSYFALSGNYANNSQGFTWSVRVEDGKFVINCVNKNIIKLLNRIAEVIKVAGEEEKDLENFQKVLPEQVDTLKLKSSEIHEYLA